MDVSAAVKMGVDAVLGAGVGFGAVLGIDEGVSIGTGVVSVWVRGDFHLSASRGFFLKLQTLRRLPILQLYFPAPLSLLSCRQSWIQCWCRQLQLARGRGACGGTAEIGARPALVVSREEAHLVPC